MHPAQSEPFPMQGSPNWRAINFAKSFDATVAGLKARIMQLEARPVADERPQEIDRIERNGNVETAWLKPPQT